MICDTPYFVLPKGSVEKVPVPCGKCPPCKIRRVNGWVFRMLEEAKVSSFAHFVTFTYDTRFVPISNNGFMTLCKRDFQLFMKRLRKLCPEGLKYYAVGEYGSTNHRPHYHAIIFNVPDVAVYAKAWTFGDIHIGDVSGASIAYTMKYIDKQKFRPNHGRDDREPEFPLMSKGLGKSYLSDSILDYHKADISRMYVTLEGGYRTALPRYFREKIYSESDKKHQVRLIESVVSDQLDADRREFDRLYSGTDYTFEAWKSSQAYGRYRSFYSSQLNRDL